MQREPAGPGQESVWDYPRPPALVRSDRHVVVVLGGVAIAETRGALRLLETSHPPTWYLPRSAFVAGALRSTAGSSTCEWKGQAAYFDLVGGDRVAPRAAWGYPDPRAPYEALLDHVATSRAVARTEDERGHDEPDDTDDHQDVADDVDVQPRDVEVHGEGENGADGDQEDADTDAHGFLPVGRPAERPGAGRSRAD